MMVRTCDTRRLLVVAPSMGLGGAERQTHLLLTEIDRAAWEPMLCTLDARGYFFDATSQSGVPSVCLDDAKGRLSVGLFKLRQLMRSFRPDVVLARGFTATTLARLSASTLAPRPRVVVAEHCASRMPHRRVFHDVVDRALTPLTDAFTYVAEGQQSYLVDEKRLPFEKLHLIANGVRVPDLVDQRRHEVRRELGLAEEDFVVGVVGSLRPEKDHIGFVRAAAHTARAYPTARFVIVGDGPMRPAVEAAVSEADMVDRFVMTGARQDVERLLSAFDVFSLSSRSEASPMSVLEAMALRLPVVATRVGGLPQIVTDGVTGLLVPPNDPESLSAAWLRLAEDPQLRRKLGDAGRDLVETGFSANRMARDHEKLFLSLVSDGTRAMSTCEGVGS